MSERALVIGGGLSGLARAWRLVDAGASVEVVEAAERPGGLIATTQTPWGPAEHAANAFVWNDAVANLFQRLNIEPVFALDSSKRRFLYRNGRPRRWPLTPLETLSTAARTGWTMVTRGMKPRGTETVGEWGRRVMGPAAVQHVIAPALQGIYAASPDQLSAQAVVGHRRRRSAVMATPAGGMGQFISVLHAALEARGVRFHFGRTVDALEPGVQTWICTNAPVAAALVRPHAPDAASLIARVELAALAAVTAFYEPHADDVRGFGILFPRGDDVQALGVLFNADIFPERGPHRSETWIYGGSTLGALPEESSLSNLIARDRRHLTGRSQTPLGTHVAYWPQAFPIYNQAVADLACVSGLLPPWLHLAGNYLGKRGVGEMV